MKDLEFGPPAVPLHYKFVSLKHSLLRELPGLARSPTHKLQHGSKAATTKRKLKSGTLIARMSTKLRRAGYRSQYRLRKQIVEPVFGQIKQARGFRQFLLRTIDKVKAEWAMICTAHNLAKLAAAR
jgi:hypothetical protein